jgi:hypothetical protein
MMAPGNAAGGFGMDKEWLKFNKEAGASFAASLKTVGMLESDIKATQSNYSKFWNGLSPVLDDLFGIFQGGITDDVTNVSQVGKSQYPLIVKHIQDLEKSSKITAQESEQLQNATRKLLNPAESDLTQQNIQRIELAQNESGQSFVKRASTERFGKTYKPQVRSNFLKELSLRGLAQPANYKDEYQFAHIPESQKTMRFVPPFLRKKSGAGSALEQQVMAMAASGMIIKEGDIINTSGKVVDAAQVSVKNRQKSKSPSKVAKQLALDFGAGYQEGLAESLPGIEAEGAAIADAAAGGASGGGTGGGSTGGTTGGSSGRSGRFGKRFGAIAGKFKGMRPGAAMAGVSGAVIGASMLPGAVGDFAQKLIPATMALQTMAMLQGPLKMILTNPYAAAAAGIVGLAVATKLYNDAAEKGAKKLEEAAKTQAEALIGSADSAKNFAEFIGTTTAAQREFSRNNKKIITASEAKTLTYTNYYKSAQGQGNAQALAKAGTSGTGVNASAMDVARRAAIFNLSPADIAANIRAAAKMSGADELQIKAKVEQMLFNGKDLTKEPLTLDARMNFLNTQTKQNLDSLKSNITKLSKVDLSKTSAIFPSATNYQDLRRAAGAQKSINDSYSGGIGGNIMGGLKQTFRFVKNLKGDLNPFDSVKPQGVIQSQNVIKDFNKVQNDVAVASAKIKMAFSDESQYLGILNAQYADGLISQQKYDEEFANSAQRINDLTIAQSKFIEQLDKIDPSSKLGEAAIKDLVNNALAPLSKESPELFKEIKKDIDALPKNKRVEIAMGLADGSYTIADVVELKKYLDMIVNGGMTYEAVISIMYDDKASAVNIARMKIDALEAKKASQTDPKVLGRINAQISKQKKIISDAAKVNQEPKPKTGTTTLDPNAAGAAKSESTILDNIVKQYRDVNNGNVKMTEGWKASYATLQNIFKSGKGGFASNGLAEMIKGKGGSKPLMDLILGMSPQDWKDHAKDLFNFDKNGKITKLTDFAKNLGNILGNIFAGNLVQKNKDFVTGLQNQQKVVAQLTSTGMSYSDALQFINTNGQEAVDALANLDPASEAWAKLKQSIDDANAALLATPEGRRDAILKYVATAEADINTRADAMKAAAQAQLDADQAAVDAAQQEIENAQRAMEPWQKLIDKNNHTIDLLQHQMDVQFDKPLAALNEQANSLNNNLTIMDHQAQAINEQFDKQQEALNAVSKINQQIIAQNKQQVSLADAITSGDMSAAAQAVQDMRAQNAANAASSQQDSLDAARKNAIDGLTVGGQTRKQIEEQLYQIGQQTFALEQQKKNLQDQINALQDQNWGYQQQIYKIEQDQLVPAQDHLRTAQDILKAHQDKLKADIDALNYEGLTVTQLEVMKTNANLAYQEYVKVKDAAAATAGSASSANSSIKGYAATLNALKDKTITITEVHNIVYNYTSTGDPNAGSSGGGGSGSKGAAAKAFGGFIRAMAGGGNVRGNGILDTVPTMLTPGEFVVNRRSAKAYAPLLQSINGQVYPEMQGRMGTDSTVSALGGGKYTTSTSNNSNNYQLSVHLNGANMDADQVAQTVIRKIKLMERNNIRRSAI